MVLLRRPHASAGSLDAGLHGAAAIAMVGGIQRLHEGVAAGIMRFLRHQQQVALHIGRAHEDRTASRQPCLRARRLEHGIQTENDSLDEHHGVAGGAGEGYES